MQSNFIKYQIDLSFPCYVDEIIIADQLPETGEIGEDDGLVEDQFLPTADLQFGNHINGFMNGSPVQVTTIDF